MDAQEEKDLAVMARLEELGSDFSKPHEVDFFLYFSSEETAKAASSEIEKEGYLVKVDFLPPPWWKKLFTKTIWSCCASKKMLLQKEAILETSAWFNGIAQRFCGEYDGWGSEVTE